MIDGEQMVDYDAMVVGAGVTGMYQTRLLKQQGLGAIGIGTSSGVGATWSWNRYSGCRLDTESYANSRFKSAGRPNEEIHGY